MKLSATCPNKHNINRTVHYLSTQILQQWKCYLPIYTNTPPWNCYQPIHTNTTPMELLATCPHKHYTNRTVSYLSTQILHQLNCYLPVHTNTTPLNCYLPIHTNTTPMELLATCPHNHYINGTVSYLSTQTLHQWNCQLPVHTNTTPIKLLATCPHKRYTMEVSATCPHK